MGWAVDTSDADNKDLSRSALEIPGTGRVAINCAQVVGMALRGRVSETETKDEAEDLSWPLFV